jgi:dTDP-4-dehydrorhamnose 3,5-epimerase
MKAIKTEIEDVRIIEVDCFHDHRGWFMESYNKERYIAAGIDTVFAQDNHSFSAYKGTLRGLHFQNIPKAQTKLVRCTKGRILDVAVDIRKNSPTYRKWVAVELSEENQKQLLIPQGFAHGFLTLTDNVEVQYKVDNVYSQEHDRGIRYDDPTLGIVWDEVNPILSEKDANLPLLTESDANFVYEEK